MKSVMRQEKYHKQKLVNNTVIEEEGYCYCWYNEKDEPHREDGPALEYDDGTKHWYQNGLHHRLDGPAIESIDGSKFWYKNGKKHREDGPAVEMANGNKRWHFEGKLHRLDGPAIEHTNFKIWAYQDQKVDCQSQEDFEKLLKLKAFW